MSRIYETKFVSIFNRISIFSPARAEGAKDRVSNRAKVSTRYTNYPWNVVGEKARNSFDKDDNGGRNWVLLGSRNTMRFLIVQLRLERSICFSSRDRNRNPRIILKVRLFQPVHSAEYDLRGYSFEVMSRRQDGRR